MTNIEPSIEGVRVIPLRRIPDERGEVMHMLRADQPHFQQFGEIYFSSVLPGKVKAWRFHHRQTLNYAVPVGTIKLVLFDDRPESPTRGQVMELLVGEPNYSLVIVPPCIWYGFQGVSKQAALVANCATLAHDPNESERCEPGDERIPYDWNG